MDQNTYCQSLFDFHSWRREKISALIRTVSPEFLNKEMNGSFSSIFIVLKHLVWAEMVWYSRVDQDQIAWMKEKEQDVEALLGEWEKIGKKWEGLVKHKSEAELNTKFVYFTTTGEKFENSLFEIIVHLMDHSTYHIGQMMNAIRAFGLEPVSTNFIHYLRAQEPIKK